MSTKQNARSAAFALLATVVSGCGAASSASDEPEIVAALPIPEPRTARAAIPPELAVLTYPSGGDARDPFLKKDEEKRETALLLEPGGEGSAGPINPVVWPKSVKPPPPLHHTKGIVLGPRSNFEYDGRHYEVGDAIAGTTWVVRQISESGASLRSKDGKFESFAPFVREGAIICDFSQ